MSSTQAPSFNSAITTLSMPSPTAATAWDTGQLNDTSAFSNTTTYSPLEDGPLEEVVSTPNWAALTLVAVMGLALAANLGVVVVVWRSKALHAPFAVLASLAVSDVLKTLTVMPLSILRLLFGGSLPQWICRLWSQLYLSYASVTLIHLAVALLHCHVALHNPRWYRRLSATCTAAIQVVVSWLLPVLLALPHTLYFTWTQDPCSTTESTATCLPLYPLYFTTGVFPTFLIPALLAGVIYIQVVMTLSIQRRAAAGMHPDPVSEVSSNGFVTYENSEASSSEEERGQNIKHLPQEQGYHGNGYVTNDVIHRDVIVHDVMVENAKEVEACCEVEEAGVAAVEGQPAATPPDDDTSEPGSPPGHDPPQEHGQDREHKVCDVPSGLADSGLVDLDNVDSNACGEDMATPTASTAATGITAILTDARQKAIDGVLRSTDCTGVNLVLVKAKVGKEALNEPLEATATDDIQLQMASFLIINSCCSSPEGVENPAFLMEDSDMPLSESIKPKANVEEVASPIAAAKEAPSLESLNVNGVGKNGGTPTGVSRTSSSSGDENGYRSILKCDRAKRLSTKSVKFAVPQEQETQQPTNKPRLLSCKYKTKNGQRIRSGGKLKSSANMAGSAVEKSPVESAGVPREPKESLAKSAEFRYIAEAHRDPGARLRAQIKRNSRHARLLLVLLVVCLVCSTPYVATLTVLWFRDSLLLPQSQSLILFSLLEWLGFMPYIVYPFLYVAFSTEFCRALKAMVSKTVSSN